MNLSARIAITGFICVAAVIVVISTAVIIVAKRYNDNPTAKPSANTAKQTTDEPHTVKPRDGVASVKAGKIKKVKKPWLMGVQQPL